MRPGAPSAWGWSPTGRRRWTMAVLLVGHALWMVLGWGSSSRWQHLANLLAALKQDHVVTIRCLEQYLCTGRGRLLIIVLDNCDKRDRDEQLLMFQVAKYIQ